MNKINQQNRSRLRENRLLSEGRGLWGWVKGLSKQSSKQLINTDNNSRVISRGEGG